MLDYNEVTPGKYIILDGEPYECLASHVFRKQQRKPVNQTKLKSLITGKVTERSFHAAESIEEAEIDTKDIVFVYKNRGEYVFHEVGKPGERFTLTEDVLGSSVKFLKEKSTVTALVFNEKVIGVKIPIKVDLVVTTAPPAVKGNTATGATKQVTVETGAVLNTPIFINEGDIIRINTETGQYVERVEKK